MKSQGHPAAPGAVGQGNLFDTRRWPGGDRAGAVGRRDEAIRLLSNLGWSRRAIAAELDLSVATVARVQRRSGGAS
jgi:hypothetical protein